MTGTIKLGGKDRPLLYGMAAFKLLKQRKGVSMNAFLSALEVGDTDLVSDITYCALRIGERAEKVAPLEEYDEMDVAMWIDQSDGGIMQVMERLLDALPKPDKSDAEGGGSEPGESLSGTGTN